jgi:hypothetical protein
VKRVRHVDAPAGRHLLTGTIPSEVGVQRASSGANAAGGRIRNAGPIIASARGWAASSSVSKSTASRLPGAAAAYNSSRVRVSVSSSRNEPVHALPHDRPDRPAEERPQLREDRRARPVRLLEGGRRGHVDVEVVLTAEPKVDHAGGAGLVRFTHRRRCTTRGAPSPSSAAPADGPGVGPPRNG